MRILLTVIMLILLGAPTIAAPDTRVADILARSKVAAGGATWDSARFVRTKTFIETSGLKGPGDSLEDARTGAFVDTYKLGAFSGASGFDGKTAWEQDASGQVIIQGSDNQRQGAINEAYRRAHSYWYADRAKAAITFAGDTSEGGRKFVVLKIAPEGGRPFDMWIDAKTFLIDRIAERDARELRTTFMSDYRNVAGRMVAFATRQTNGEAKYDTIVKVESVVFEDTVAQAAFAPPPPPKRDFGLAGGKSATFPFRLVNNHIYMTVRLNGHPYEFLFDTGGLNVITPTVARELGLSFEGNIQANGSGEGSQEAAFTKVNRLEVGGAYLENQTFVVIGLESFTDVEGVPITGIVGYEIFKRFVVVTDYENSRITLIEPEGFAYKGRGLRVEMGFNDRTPEVEGEIDGLKGKFTLDTGARNTLTLSTPFVEKNDLVTRYQAKVQGVNGWGVGGPARGWIVRAKRFAMGGATVVDPVVELSQNKAGSMADAYVAGNVGAGILKKFNIVWDYGRHQIFFDPNKLQAQRDVHDRAGFWVNLAGDVFTVVDVTPGSPADMAGLKAGDRVSGVNGKRAVSQVSLPDFRLLKLAPAGTNLILDVIRGGQSLKVDILLKDMV